MFLCTVKVCHTYRVSEKKTPFEIHLYLIQNPFIFSVRDEKNYDLTQRWLVIIICRIHRNHYFSHQARRSCLDFGPTINEFQRELFWGHPVYSRRRPPGRQEVPAMSPNKQKGQKRTKKNKLLLDLPWCLELCKRCRLTVAGSFFPRILGFHGTSGSRPDSAKWWRVSNGCAHTAPRAPSSCPPRHSWLPIHIRHHRHSSSPIILRPKRRWNIAQHALNICWGDYNLTMFFH